MCQSVSREMKHFKGETELKMVDNFGVMRNGIGYKAHVDEGEEDLFIEAKDRIPLYYVILYYIKLYGYKLFVRIIHRNFLRMTQGASVRKRYSNR